MYERKPSQLVLLFVRQFERREKSKVVPSEFQVNPLHCKLKTKTFQLGEFLLSCSLDAKGIGSSQGNEDDDRGVKDSKWERDRGKGETLNIGVGGQERSFLAVISEPTTIQ